VLTRFVPPTRPSARDLSKFAKLVMRQRKAVLHVATPRKMPYVYLLVERREAALAEGPSADGRSRVDYGEVRTWRSWPQRRSRNSTTSWKHFKSRSTGSRSRAAAHRGRAQRASRERDDDRAVAVNNPPPQSNGQRRRFTRYVA